MFLTATICRFPLTARQFFFSECPKYRSLFLNICACGVPCYNFETFLDDNCYSRFKSTNEAEWTKVNTVNGIITIQGWHHYNPGLALYSVKPGHGCKDTVEDNGGT